MSKRIAYGDQLSDDLGRPSLAQARRPSERATAASIEQAVPRALGAKPLSDGRCAGRPAWIVAKGTMPLVF